MITPKHKAMAELADELSEKKYQNKLRTPMKPRLLTEMKPTGQTENLDDLYGGYDAEK
jgi:hypothetical protein